MAWGAFSLVAIAGGVVRRLHDLGLRAWVGVFALVPGVNVVFLLYLLCAPGNDGAVGRRAALSVSGLVKATAAVMLCSGPLALSLPGVLRARAAANEQAAIADLRAIVAAQVAYRAINGGEWEGRWECLAQPAACLPGHAGPPLLDADALRSPRMGYLREFHVGPPAPRPPALSATSTRGYVVVARPMPSTSDSQRAFCVDTSGRLCHFDRDPVPATLVERTTHPEGVRCASRCADLR